MRLPNVAIVGRPNVGKSTLFNALAGRRISIVDPTAGVTRDRVSAVIQIEDCFFELVDTGGYGLDPDEPLADQVTAQIMQAIDLADLILFVVDIREGPIGLDRQIADLLRRSSGKVLGVANKADTPSLFPLAGDFSQLGLGEFLCVSAKNNINKAELRQAIVSRLAHMKVTEGPAEPLMKIAIVGKRNAGKSSLVNAIAGFERVIVSEIPGTTRDAVDVRVDWQGKPFLLIDTAGCRKTAKMADPLEYYGYVRATAAIRRADVVLLMIDATVPLSIVDKQLAGFIAEQYRTCILVVNKWDLARDRAEQQAYERYLTSELPFLAYCPIAFIVAKSGEGVPELLGLAEELFGQANTQIATSRLNEVLEAVRSERPPSAKTCAVPRFYYATQIGTNPITILMFVNQPRLFDDQYRRFLVGRLRELLPISEVPIRLLVSGRRRSVPTQAAGQTDPVKGQ
ncbi:MAG: ribosome biogenesis GTPase Der [Sedimentisphaerales bacterium]|jgi:GTP-binding protein|nr:ribosome biogenesis GTPase Der [Sedimentisphaerales bacterium]